MNLTSNKSKMRYMTPKLYIALQQSEGQIKTDEEVIESADQIWEENLEKYMATTFPKVAIDFMKGPCLHDWKITYFSKLSEFHVLEFSLHEEKLIIVVKANLSMQKVFHNPARPEPYLLYDEFHYDKKSLSWHFFTNAGMEYSFENIQNFAWIDKKTLTNT